MTTDLVIAVFSGRPFLQIHTFQYRVLAVFSLDGKHRLLHFTLSAQFRFFLRLLGLPYSMVTE